MTQIIQTTQKTMHNQTLEKWATFSRYSLSQTLMSNALQYKASKGFRYIYYICRWCWGGGGGGVSHNFWEIWRGVRANLRLLRGGYCVIFLLFTPQGIPRVGIPVHFLQEAPSSLPLILKCSTKKSSRTNKQYTVVQRPVVQSLIKLILG